jgi:beta-glucosidase
MGRSAFPDGFLWGVATSAFQIEGAAGADGRGESIWDRFAATPGRIEDGSDAGVACDHYHRWREDLSLLKWLGVGAYRFSIAWPRVLPQGRGSVNVRGLDFYDALVDGLLDAGIRPCVTLYHWDLPQALQDEGGWATRDTAHAFVEYADAVTSRLGDRVDHWITHNEPWCIASLGHESGEHAPGHRDPAEALRVAHHLLLSHGWAVSAMRQNAPDAEIGITLNLTPATPASSDPADREAVRQFDGFFNRWYLDPVFHGSYPEDAIAVRVRQGQLESLELPFVEEGDMRAIAAPIDFLGVNYYSRIVVEAGENGAPIRAGVVPEEELTEMGWEVFPDGLAPLLVRLDREYRPPKMYITENGAAFHDEVGEDGRIVDPRRIEYLESHLAAAHEAIEAGVPLAGYFAWSLMDNFEWAYGYEKRFGLCHVDFETLERTPKESARWYRDTVAANALSGASRPVDLRRVP